MPEGSTLKARLLSCSRWAWRIGWGGLIVLLAMGVFVFVRADLPHEMEIFGCRLNTSILAWLDGHHVVGSETYPRDGQAPIIIGHRGSGLWNPQNKALVIGNTETAIRNAIEHGVRWIEIDVRLTADEQLVLFHDEKLGTKIDCPESWKRRAVSDLTWNELQELRLNLIPQERLLLLDEALQKFKMPDLTWVLDIKPEASERLDQAKKEKLIPVLQSLGPKRVKLFGTAPVLGLYREDEQASPTHLSEFECGLLMLKSENFANFLFHRNRVLQQCRQLGADYLVLPGIFASASFLRDAAEMDIQVLVWDCEHPTDQRNYVARGAQGLIVDAPQETKANFARSDGR